MLASGPASALVGAEALTPSQLSAAAEIVPHPLYTAKDSGSPDLAILKLTKPLLDRFVAAVLNPRVPGVGEEATGAGPGDSGGPCCLSRHAQSRRTDGRPLRQANQGGGAGGAL